MAPDFWQEQKAECEADRGELKLDEHKVHARLAVRTAVRAHRGAATKWNERASQREKQKNWNVINVLQLVLLLPSGSVDLFCFQLAQMATRIRRTMEAAVWMPQGDAGWSSSFT